MKGTVSNCHAPLGYPYTRGDHCWRVTGTTAFAAALICRYSYDAPRREEDASKNERAAQNGPGTRDCFRITHGRFYERIGLIWSDRVNTAKAVGFLSLSLLSFPEDRASSSRSSFERRLISLIFAGRNRIIMIRRELPLTVIASPVEPVA